MKKQYTSPQFDYWCYISGKLCDGVGAALYATSNPSQPGGKGEGMTQPGSAGK